MYTLLIFLQNLLDALVPRIDRHFAAWVWLRLLLAHHAAFFLSCTSGVDASLAALHSALQSRLANHQPMLRLLGRLELLEAQRTMVHTTEENNDAKAEIVFQGTSHQLQVALVNVDLCVCRPGQ